MNSLLGISFEELSDHFVDLTLCPKPPVQTGGGEVAISHSCDTVFIFRNSLLESVMHVESHCLSPLFAMIDNTGDVWCYSGVSHQWVNVGKPA